METNLPNDTSEASKRTFFAWNRTALGMIAISALSIKVGSFAGHTGWSLFAVTSFVGSLLLFLIGKNRYNKNISPFIPLCIGATVVALLGVTTFVSFL